MIVPSKYVPQTLRYVSIYSRGQNCYQILISKEKKLISVAYDTCNRLHFLVLLYCSLCISDNKMETKRRFVCCFIDELGRLKYSNSAGFWALLQHAQLSWPSWSVTKNFIYCLRIVIFSSQIVIKPKPLRYELKRGCYLLT